MMATNDFCVCCSQACSCGFAARYLAAQSRPSPVVSRLHWARLPYQGPRVPDVRDSRAIAREHRPRPHKIRQERRRLFKAAQTTWSEQRSSRIREALPPSSLELTWAERAAWPLPDEVPFVNPLPPAKPAYTAKCTCVACLKAARSLLREKERYLKRVAKRAALKAARSVARFAYRVANPPQLTSSMSYCGVSYSSIYGVEVPAPTTPLPIPTITITPPSEVDEDEPTRFVRRRDRKVSDEGWEDLAQTFLEEGSYSPPPNSSPCGYPHVERKEDESPLPLPGTIRH